MEYFFSPSPKEGVSEQILMWLPLTLFFPVGFMYTGLLAFWISWVLTGNWKKRWALLRTSPLLLPVLLLSLITLLMSLMNRSALVSNNELWSAVGHYQTYLLVLPFLTLASGKWQQKMENIFLGSAVLAAMLFLLNMMHLLPDISLFKSYVVYLGNKSILLGILLALAACWMWARIVFERQVSVRNIALFVFLAAAAVFLAKTRTAVLLFVLGFLIVTLCSIRWSWKSVLFIAVFIASISTFWTYAVNQPRPATCVVNEVKAAPWEILHLRAVCTLQQVNDLREGRRSKDDDGMRSEIYRITSGIISEQPLLGHGAGSWMPIYHARADGLSSGTMTTPHSDYLLYLTELGLIGLFGLIIIWGQQIRVSVTLLRSASLSLRQRGMQLLLLTLFMTVGAFFNAIMRDAVFAVAFLILLSIPLSGLRR